MIDAGFFVKSFSPGKKNINTVFEREKNDIGYSAGMVRLLSAHLEADVLQGSMKVVQHSAAIKYKGRLQHLLVNLLIVQLLW